jgi:membrane-anchored protein YejM (alkaline phosphatase superfamily)
MSWFKFDVPVHNNKMVTRDVMSWGFWYYSFLSLVVKIILGGSYMGFVVMFPFSTAGTL